MILFGGEYIYNDDTKPTIFNEICHKNIRRTYENIAIITLITFVSGVIGAANPLYIFYHDDKLYTLPGVLIPFVKRFSIEENIINIIYQAVLAYVACFAFIILQISSRLIVDVINASVDVSVCEMKDLSNDLEQNDLSQMEIGHRILKIIQQIERINEYVSDIGEIYY